MRTIPDNDYELLDSGTGLKLERFGDWRIVRPCGAAVWNPGLPPEMWQAAHAVFGRRGGNTWTFREPPPASWNVRIDGMVFKLSMTAFGHLGVFPEQRESWKEIRDAVRRLSPAGRRLSMLNLFAYSGGSTVAAAAAGAAVCHLDASRGMVARARENIALNGLESAPIRWIVEDVTRFLDRELRRGSRYDAIVLDPPSFGRGKSGEVYKIETDLPDTLKKCVSLLSDTPAFVLLSCHTPAMTPLVLNHLLRQSMGERAGTIRCGEMVLAGAKSVFPVPSGSYAAWETARKP